MKFKSKPGCLKSLSFGVIFGGMLVLTCGCSVISDSVTTDTELLERSGKALGVDSRTLTLNSRDRTTATVMWVVEDANEIRYLCSYLSLLVVDDANTSCEVIPKRSVWGCPTGYLEAPEPNLVVCLLKDKNDHSQPAYLDKEDLKELGLYSEGYW